MAYVYCRNNSKGYASFIELSGLGMVATVQWGYHSGLTVILIEYVKK